jgi:hypothetical protein
MIIQARNDGVSRKKPTALRSLFANGKYEKPRCKNIFDSKSENIPKSVVLLFVTRGQTHEFSASILSTWAYGLRQVPAKLRLRQRTDFVTCKEGGSTLIFSFPFSLRRN